MIDITKYIQFISEKRTLLRVKKEEIAQCEQEISFAKEELSDLKQAQEALSIVGTAVQQNICKIIQDLVTEGLQTIFGPTYKFIIESSLSRNKPEIEFYIEENGHKHSIREEHGGSIAALVSFILRIVLIAIGSQRYRQIVILDEPFKDIDKQKLEELGKFLEELQNLLNMQIILITHEDQLKAICSKMFSVKKINNVSIIESVLQEEN